MKRPFWQIIKAAWSTPLPTTQKTVFACLASHCSDEGQVHDNLQTHNDIASRTGLSRRAVVKALGDLVEEGWVEQVTRKGRHNRFLVNLERLDQFGLFEQTNEPAKGRALASVKPSNLRTTFTGEPRAHVPDVHQPAHDVRGGVHQVHIQVPLSPCPQEGEGSTPPPATPPKTEAGDLVPVLADVVGISLAELTPAARSEIHRQAEQLHAVGATSDEVRRRAKRWLDRPRNRAKGRALEVRFLVADWAALAGKPPAAQRAQSDTAELDARSRAQGDLQLLGNPPGLTRAEGESWVAFSDRVATALRDRPKRAVGA